MEVKTYTMAQAIAEAKRCLHCKVPQCRKGCPVENDIPAWIHELSMGNPGNAMSIINARSNLPAVCGRVCAHERQCEGNCVLGKKGAHIHIGMLEQFVADFDTEMNLTHEPLVQKDRGRVAVIGSGPAGLTVAGELARKGFDVEIFEMEPDAGGVLRFGIPEYRLPKAVVDSEIRKISNLGVRINTGITVGPDLNVDTLFSRGFDAIFMGTGAGKPRKLPIEGAELVEVRQAIYFLRRVSLYNAGLIARSEVPVSEGDKVFVIGCGNTAIDAARTAIRMGAAQVTIVYHRDISRMSALR
ncbi:MAG: FAD-dependent oxidoreductase, partial [Muribaculaceae bacterium]|nr:FAD-dependent oxidoreductase [Muribaculaceae bacterium]